MMQPDVFIRVYEARDKPALIDLLRSNTPNYFSPEEEKDLLFYLDHETEQYFVVENKNTIVGCGGINFSENRTRGIISWDILHPAMQGKGIGSLLLQHRLNILRSLPEIKTVTVRTSQMAYRFYEKQGFTLLEVKKNYWAQGFDMYRMEGDLRLMSSY